MVHFDLKKGPFQLLFVLQETVFPEWLDLRFSSKSFRVYYSLSSLRSAWVIAMSKWQDPKPENRKVSRVR